MYEGKFPHKRYKLTYQFLEKHISKEETILDLGVENPFTEVMKNGGFKIKNTSGEDIDEDTSTIENSEAISCNCFRNFRTFIITLYGFKIY